MRYTTGLLVAILVGLGVQTHSASAQTFRTWVSGVGDDSNACSRTAPCKTFAGALSKTTVGGEINVLDPGSFGTPTITNSITIIADGTLGAVLAAQATAISVELTNSTDKVVLKGLDLQAGVSGTTGIRMSGQGKLTIIDCVIRGFGTAGIDVKGAAGARVLVDRSTIVNNGFGIRVNGASNVANVAFVQRSLIDANSSAGVQVENASTVVLSDNTISGSGGADLSTLNGGQAISYGNNLIRSGNPTQTQALK